MKLQQEWISSQLRDDEQQFFHRETNEETAFYRAVCTGDIEAVLRNCEQQRFLATDGVGILSKDPLVNIKYHFVITAALVTRSCANAGMEMEQAFRLSDFYIRKLDTIQTTHGVATLHRRMVMDFATKMKMLRSGTETSKPISTCINYIYTHITERITIESLAEHTGLSASYLSRLFKQEVGIPVSEYIRKKKLGRAEELLKYSNYSLDEISDFLSFASTSHFIQAFKLYTGMTPKKFRDRYTQSGIDGETP